MEKASWTIYWNEYSSDTYLYGSEIDFHGKNNVHFKNELMPPGTVIKQWYSMTNYQAQRIEPSLPIIDGESKYHIKINVETPGEGGYLVRLVFLDRYEREAGDFTIRDKEADFSCPLKTYSYRMQLINAGMTEFTYHSITIEEIDSED
ncbi:MAG: accessory Sec system protein Asp3 [Pseudobutyrivibrio ruminis]|nr:accessory Sec system protein Asp3 [Pseudobutyrivibrio ruminis]MBO6129859.1 accessory Sec system protein Asp3 [Pseudobutyrivibrio sp.]